MVGWLAHSGSEPFNCSCTNQKACEVWGHHGDMPSFHL